jgi:hypothetical protein
MLQQKFATMAQKSIYERVATWMREMYGEQAVELPDVPAMALSTGSSSVYINVGPWNEHDAVISVRALVAMEVNLSPDLLYFLLLENAGFSFGCFGILERGTVVFEHGLLGSTLDKDELRNSISVTAWTADEYDDKIVSRWGEKRWVDA